MKIIVLTLAFAVIALSAPADQSPIEKPTKRMLDISEKYNLMPAYVFHKEDDTKKGEYWVFIGKTPKYKFKMLPVIVPKNSSDAMVELAIMEAEVCASFYDHLLEKEKTEQDKGQQQGI